MDKSKGLILENQTQEVIQGFVLDTIDDTVGGATDVSDWLAFMPEADVDITYDGGTATVPKGVVIWLREFTTSITFATGPTPCLIMYRK